MFAHQSIFQSLPGHEFSGSVVPLTVTGPTDPASKPVPQEPERPQASVIHAPDADLAFLAGLKPQSAKLRERQSILLGKAHALMQEMDALANDIGEERQKTLLDLLEGQENLCRECEDHILLIQAERGALTGRLNLAAEKRIKAEAAWNMARDAKPAHRWPTAEETREVAEAAEKARVAFCDAREGYARLVAIANKLDAQITSESVKLNGLGYVAARIKAAVENRPIADRETGLVAVPEV